MLAKLGPLHQHDTGRLRAYLQRVPDPRSRHGRWYPLVGLLLICACAVVSGARTITEWGQRATTAVLELLGIRRHLPGRRRAPSHATLTRLLAALGRGCPELMSCVARVAVYALAIEPDWNTESVVTATPVSWVQRTVHQFVDLPVHQRRQRRAWHVVLGVHQVEPALPASTVGPGAALPLHH